MFVIKDVEIPTKQES